MNFEIGDRVKYIDVQGRSDLVGKIGVVKYIHPHLLTLGVEFNERIYNGNDLDGHGREGYCWYCPSCALSRMFPEEEPEDELEEEPERLIMWGSEEPSEYVPSDPIELHAFICGRIHGLYKDKNADYGDSFAATRRKYPNAILIRLHDKFSRLEKLYATGEARVDESIADTLMDLAGYCILELTEMEKEKLK